MLEKNTNSQLEMKELLIDICEEVRDNGYGTARFYLLLKKAGIMDRGNQDETLNNVMHTLNKLTLDGRKQSTDS
jgi:hypothetical protein